MLLVVVCQHLHNVFRIRHPSVAGAQPFERWREWTEMGSRTLPYVIPFGKLCNFCLTTWLHAFCSLHLINFLLGSKTVKIERCTWPPVCTSILVGGSSEEEQLRWPRWTEWTHVTVGATTILQSVKKWGKECEKRICVEIVDKCVPVLVDHREKERKWKRSNLFGDRHERRSSSMKSRKALANGPMFLLPGLQYSILWYRA